MALVGFRKVLVMRIGCLMVVDGCAGADGMAAQQQAYNKDLRPGPSLDKRCLRLAGVRDKPASGCLLCLTRTVYGLKKRPSSST